MNKKAFYLAAILLFMGLALSGLGSTKTAFADSLAQICRDSGGEWRSADGGAEQFCDCPGQDLPVSGVCPGGGTDNSQDSPNNNTVKDPDEADAKRITDYVQKGVNLITALAGVAISAAFIMGGIQYSTSGGNPTASAAAKKKIGNAVGALIALVFLYTFLQWIVPGGIFSN